MKTPEGMEYEPLMRDGIGWCHTPCPAIVPVRPLRMGLYRCRAQKGASSRTDAAAPGTPCPVWVRAVVAERDALREAIDKFPATCGERFLADFAAEVTGTPKKEGG